MDLFENPVVMPCCKKYMCKKCVDGLASLGTARCPHCNQQRLQNKIRTAEKKGSLYATELWEKIQKKFPNFDYENDEVTFVDSDKDVVSGVIRREVNGELRAEYEANEARIQAEIDRRAKEEEAKLMKMTETAKNDADPEQRQIAADILRNKKIAEEERLSLELIKKLTEGGGNLGNSDAVKSSGSNGNALPGRIDLEEQRKIMDAIERKRESSRSAIVSGAVASQTSSKRKLASESSPPVTIVEGNEYERSSKYRRFNDHLRTASESVNEPIDVINISSATHGSSQPYSSPEISGSISMSGQSVPKKRNRKWACHVCTYRNKKMWLRCGMCGTVRRRTQSLSSQE